MYYNFKKIDAIIIVILIIIAGAVLISVGYVKPPITPITPPEPIIDPISEPPTRPASWKYQYRGEVFTATEVHEE